MRLRVFASGSKGNSLAVRSAGGTLLLVDLGLSLPQLRERATACGVDVGTASAVLFTHDHVDHFCGVAAFHRHYPDIPLFANGDTSDAIAAKTGVADGWTVFETAVPFDFADFRITPFSISHDAADPVGFLIENEGHALFVGTDMGYVKQRIAGRSGHLANADAAELVRAVAPVRLKTILLAHLSEECNSPSLARATMCAALAECGCADVRVEVLDQHSPSDLMVF